MAAIAERLGGMPSPGQPVRMALAIARGSLVLARLPEPPRHRSRPRAACPTLRARRWRRAGRRLP